MAVGRANEQDAAKKGSQCHDQEPQPLGRCAPGNRPPAFHCASQSQSIDDLAEAGFGSFEALPIAVGGSAGG